MFYGSRSCLSGARSSFWTRVLPLSAWDNPDLAPAQPLLPTRITWDTPGSLHTPTPWATNCLEWELVIIFYKSSTFQESIVNNQYSFLSSSFLFFVSGDLGCFYLHFFSLLGFFIQTSNSWSSHQNMISRAAVVWSTSPHNQKIKFHWQIHSVLQEGAVMSWSSNWTKLSCGHLPASAAFHSITCLFS